MTNRFTWVLSLPMALKPDALKMGTPLYYIHTRYTKLYYCGAREGTRGENKRRLRHGPHQAADKFRVRTIYQILRSEELHFEYVYTRVQQHFEYVHACSEVLLVLQLAIALRATGARRDRTCFFVFFRSGFLPLLCCFWGPGRVGVSASSKFDGCHYCFVSHDMLLRV